MDINTFFLRISACCNLDCDYCYVFKHRDRAWENYPPTMTIYTVSLFADRLNEYANQHKNIKEFNIVFHGGEPLICGSARIQEFIGIIDKRMEGVAQVNYSLQTNGTLLTQDFVKFCDERGVGISLSIDGHTDIHNKHRKYKNGKGSHEDALRGINLLKEHQDIFEGVIGVVDPCFDPEVILGFFKTQGINNIDLLLPDSTYQDLPKGRNENPELYIDWLIKAFDAWFYRYPDLHFRTFETLLKSFLGDETTLDTFGGGFLDYLTIETDGSYHTSDILKSTYENASFMGLYLSDCSVDTALSNKKVIEYNELLSSDNLPEQCKKCEHSKICGGGSLPHRYSVENGFDNPTVYCDEMKALIKHAREVIIQAINDETNEK